MESIKKSKKEVEKGLTNWDKAGILTKLSARAGGGTEKEVKSLKKRLDKAQETVVT